MPTKSHPDDGREQHEEALMGTIDVDPILKQLIIGNTAGRTELTRGISVNVHYSYRVLREYQKMYSHPLDTMAGITEVVAFSNNAVLNPYSANALIEKDNREK